MATETHPTTKAAVAEALAKLGVELSPSRVKKTSLADLIKVLDEAQAAEKSRVAAPRRSKGVNLPPKPATELKACREGTKQAALIDCLASGATLWELVGACSRNAGGGSRDWSENSVKSALYYDVNKVKGYGIRTEMMTPREAYDAGHEAATEHLLGTDQEQEAVVPVYFLVLPDGMAGPLPHAEAAPTKKAENSS